MLTTSAHNVYYFRNLTHAMRLPIPAGAPPMFSSNAIQQLDFCTQLDFKAYFDLKSKVISKTLIRERFQEFIGAKIGLMKLVTCPKVSTHSTLKQLLNIKCKTESFISQEWHIEFLTYPNPELTFVSNFSSTPPWEYTLEKMIDVLLALRKIMGNAWSPVAMRFSNQYPKRWLPEDLTRLQILLDCKLHFDSGTNAMRLAKSDLDFQMSDDEFAEKIYVIDPSKEGLECKGLVPVPNFINLVRATLKDFLIRKIPTAKDIYTELDIHPRSFQRYLERYGVSFRVLLDDVLCEKFYELAEKKSMNYKEIRQAIGFSSKSAFYRAKHRWKNM